MLEMWIYVYRFHVMRLLAVLVSLVVSARARGVRGHAFRNYECVIPSSPCVHGCAFTRPCCS